MFREIPIAQPGQRVACHFLGFPNIVPSSFALNDNERPCTAAHPVRPASYMKIDNFYTLTGRAVQPFPVQIKLERSLHLRPRYHSCHPSLTPRPQLDITKVLAVELNRQRREGPSSDAGTARGFLQ